MTPLLTVPEVAGIPSGVRTREDRATMRAWLRDGGRLGMEAAARCILSLIEVVDREPAACTVLSSVERPIPGVLDGLPVSELLVHSFPVEPCVYFLIRERAVAYVGQTRRPLLMRIIAHAESRNFDQVLWLPCGAHLLDDVERALIKILDPPDNIAGKGNRSDGYRLLSFMEEDALKLAGLAFMTERRAP